MATSTNKNSTMQRMIDSLSKNANVKKLMGEFHRLSEDIKARTNRAGNLDLKLDPRAKAALKKARGRYQTLLKQIQKTQTRLKGELNGAAQVLKKSVKDVSTDLEEFQNLASKKGTLAIFTSGKSKKKVRKAPAKKASSTAKARKRAPSRRKSS